MPREKREPEPDEPPERNPRWSALARTAAAFKDFRPAREVFKVIRAVPTRFVQFDHGTRVGGFPVERYTLVHGASNEGKSAFATGTAGSFLEKDHLVFHVDAERTMTSTWTDTLIGGLVDHPFYKAIRPDSYEETIAEVRNFLNIAIDLRAKKKVPPDTCALVLVDSTKKLIPKSLLEEILSADAEEKDVTSGRDRRAQLQARMNAAWMDEMTILLDKAQAGMLAIAREFQDPDADQWAVKAKRNYKVGGGLSIFYEAALVVRCERAGWIEVGSGKDRRVYGERIRALIRKTKVGGKEDRDIATYFHLSNGQLVPEGFDRPRDVLEMASRMGVVQREGAAYAYDGQWLCRQGENQTVAMLHKRPELVAEIEARVRDLSKAQPTAFDPETGETE